jgi:hypothetical protein
MRDLTCAAWCSMAVLTLRQLMVLTDAMHTC